MESKLQYAAAAVKELGKMSPDVRRRITSKVNRLSNDLAEDAEDLRTLREATAKNAKSAYYTPEQVDRRLRTHDRRTKKAF